MAEGSLFDHETERLPAYSEGRFIRLGQGVMDNPDMLDDLATLMRDAADQIERARIQQSAKSTDILPVNEVSA